MPCRGGDAVVMTVIMRHAAIISDLRCSTLRDIARGTRTRTGGRWHRMEMDDHTPMPDTTDPDRPPASSALGEEAARDILAERFIDSAIPALELLSVHLGLELGLYRALDGGATETELATRAGIALRYAREWLEQQTV